MKNVEQTGTFEEKYFVVNIGLEFLIDDYVKYILFVLLNTESTLKIFILDLLNLKVCSGNI